MSIGAVYLSIRNQGKLFPDIQLEICHAWSYKMLGGFLMRKRTVKTHYTTSLIWIAINAWSWILCYRQKCRSK